MSRYGLSGRQDKTENYEPRRYSDRAYRCVVSLSTLFYPHCLTALIIIFIMVYWCCYQDIENALHVSNTARKDTGDDKLVGRLQPPILSPCFHFIQMYHVSSVSLVDTDVQYDITCVYWRMYMILSLA